MNGFFVYFFYNDKQELLYIGKTTDLINRIFGHNHLPIECYAKIDRIDFVDLNSKREMDLLEYYFISKYKPRYNKVYVKHNINSDFKIDESCLGFKNLYLKNYFEKNEFRFLFMQIFYDYIMLKISSECRKKDNYKEYMDYHNIISLSYAYKYDSIENCIKNNDRCNEWIFKSMSKDTICLMNFELKTRDFFNISVAENVFKDGEFYLKSLN